MCKKIIGLYLYIFIFLLIIVFNNNISIAKNLEITTTLSFSDKHEEVKDLQHYLTKLGLHTTSGNLTSYYGENTETAVKAVQKYYGIAIDGITSGNTAYAINKLLETNSSQQKSSLQKYQKRYLFMLKNADLNGKTLKINGRNIYYKGTEYTNASSRNGKIPRIIVDHITGTNSFWSTHLWFTKSYNAVSSANFVIDRDGTIYQYVKITNAAWANGIKSGKLKDVKSNYVKELGYGANNYSVSIEHVGTNGNLAQAQLEASVWLHKYIRDFVRDVYGYKIPLNRTHVIGHYQIDPINKYFCPGPKFPWSELMERIIK